MTVSTESDHINITIRSLEFFGLFFNVCDIKLTPQDLFLHRNFYGLFSGICLRFGIRREIQYEFMGIRIKGDIAVE
jgi:hypothetical protein